MKKAVNLFLLIVSILGLLWMGLPSTLVSADDYYAKVDTSTSEKLLDSLHSIISTGTTDVGYPGLWDAYKTTDVKPGTNIIWDMYSNEEYEAGGKKQGGNYSKEGDAYNREHSVPQSWFGEKSPMKADLFHVYPTDGYVNNRRSNYMFGEVGSASYTSKNGSKLGTSSFSGYSGTVFEPIDEYKGDFARTYFYMATRYSTGISSWPGGKEAFSSSFPYLSNYSIKLFLKWSAQDPVSEKETTRNEAVYKIQKNRNPFIDHPEYINLIWGNTDYKPSTDTKYTVTFNANGGTFGSSDTVKYQDVNTLTIPTNPTKEGYTFAGWNTVSSASTTMTLTLGSAVISNVTYYAVWRTGSGSGTGGNTTTTKTTATYSITGVDTVDEVNAPKSSQASYIQDYETPGQFIKDKKGTLTLKGYAGEKINSITLSIKSNKSSGSGYISVASGTKSIYKLGSATSGVAFNDETFKGSWNTEYSDFTLKFESFTVAAGEDLVITIGATANSLYCQSITVSYGDEAGGEVPPSGDDTDILESFKYYTVYTKLTFGYGYSETPTTVTTAKSHSVTYSGFTNTTAIEEVTEDTRYNMSDYLTYDEDLFDIYVQTNDATKYNCYHDELYLYMANGNGTELIIEAKDGIKITGITFTVYQEKYISNATASYTASKATIKATLEDNNTYSLGLISFTINYETVETYESNHIFEDLTINTKYTLGTETKNKIETYAKSSNQEVVYGFVIDGKFVEGTLNGNEVISAIKTTDTTTKHSMVAAVKIGEFVYQANTTRNLSVSDIVKIYLQSNANNFAVKTNKEALEALV